MVDFWSVMKPIAPKDQVVEMLNDETNEIKLHKRKTREHENPALVKNHSIMDLRVSK